MNVTGRNSRPIPDGKGGYFIEKIRAGAFERALEKAKKVSVLLNHDWNMNIGDTDSNLILKEDCIGLRAHLETSNPEIVKKAREKKLRGWSFRFFTPTEIRADKESGIPVREITDMQMDEVSLIDERMRPWYPSTTVEARAGEEGEVVYEVRAEETEPEYVIESCERKPDHSKLKELIKKYGGNV